MNTASAGAALATSTDALIAARALQGAGAAALVPLSLTLISAAVPPSRRGMAFGIWGAVNGVAIASGPLVGGTITEHLSWHWIFWLNVPIGVALLPLVLSRLAESYGPNNRLDLVGTVLAQHWSVRHRAVDRAWPRTRVDVCSGARRVRCRRGAPGGLRPVGAADAGAYAADAVLPLACVQCDQCGRLADVLRCVWINLPAHPVLAVHSGLLAAGSGIADVAVDGDAHGRGADRGCARRSDRRPVHRDLRIPHHGDRSRLFAIVNEPDVSYLTQVPAFVLSGIGMAMLFAPAGAILMGSVPPAEQGIASGVNNSVREAGGALGVAVLASVFAARGGYETPQMFTDGLVPALWVGVASLVVAAIVMLWVPRGRHVLDVPDIRAAAEVPAPA